MTRAPNDASDFDRAKARYAELVRLRDADAAHGEMAEANRIYTAALEPLKERNETRDAACPAEKEAWKLVDRDHTAAERRFLKAFSEPCWDAADAMLATPAPSIHAILEKLDVWKEEGGELQDVIAIVEADLRRLAQ